MTRKYFAFCAKSYIGLTEEEFRKNEPYSSTDIDNYESAFVITDIPEEKLYQEHFQR